MYSLNTTENSSSNDLSFPHLTTSFFVVRLSILSTLMLVTLLFNIILLYILWKVKDAKTIKDDGYSYYIMNLCILDLLALTACTTFALLYKIESSCDQFARLWKVFSTLQILLSSAWIGTVSVMAMEKWRLAQYPLLKRVTFQRMKYRLMVVWLWALCNSTPQLFLYEDTSVEIHWHCTHPPSWHHLHKLVYPVLRMISIFVIPSVIILISSFGISRHHFTFESALSLKRRKGNQQFAYLAFTLWFAFFCTNLPKHIIELEFSFEHSDKYEAHRQEQMFMYVLITSWLIYLTAPVVYFIVCRNLLHVELSKLGIICLSVCAGSPKDASTQNTSKSNNLWKDQEEFDWTSPSCQYLLHNIGLLDEINTSVVTSTPRTRRITAHALATAGRNRMRKYSHAVFKRTNVGGDDDHVVLGPPRSHAKTF